jgi:hypothetical protein
MVFSKHSFSGHRMKKYGIKARFLGNMTGLTVKNLLLQHCNVPSSDLEGASTNEATASMTASTDMASFLLAIVAAVLLRGTTRK